MRSAEECLSGQVAFWIDCLLYMAILVHLGLQDSSNADNMLSIPTLSVPNLPRPTVLRTQSSNPSQSPQQDP
jgi:hypothetical protein